jgi:hypothetical protein
MHGQRIGRGLSESDNTATRIVSQIKSLTFLFDIEKLCFQNFQRTRNRLMREETPRILT